jgi:DNA replication protein DnaC
MPRVRERLVQLRLRHVAERLVAMGVQIAHFSAVQTLEDFDFKAQPAVVQRLVKEFATGRCVAEAESILTFGPPGVGKTHLAIALLGELGYLPIEKRSAHGEHAEHDEPTRRAVGRSLRR